MAKRYTRAQWEELQASFPVEDRTPYELSPDLPGTTTPGGRRSSGIVGTEMLTTPEGTEQLVYSGSDRAVRPGVPADRGMRTSSGIAGTENLVDEQGNTVLVYKGTNDPVVPGSPRAATVSGGGTTTTATTATGPASNQPKRYRASDGREFDSEEALLLYEDRLAERAAEAAKKESGRVSAFNILGDEFRRYGFDDPQFFRELQDLIKQDLSDPEIRIKVRGLPAYERRFGAIKRRIDKGFNAISEAAFLQLEDAYANTMRRFGLPESYYIRQPGRSNPVFENLVEFDISAPELEERLMLGQKRVMEAPPEVLASIRDFYGDSVTNGDILAFVVDPKNALEKIRTKVTAAEIGAGARQAGLGTTRQRAEELGRFGITGQQAQAGFQQIAGGLERGGQLAAIYQEQPYGQETAEQEIFGLTGAPTARRRRQRLTQQEQAAFGGQTGLTGGALSRERAGQF